MLPPLFTQAIDKKKRVHMFYGNHLSRSHHANIVFELKLLSSARGPYFPESLLPMSTMLTASYHHPLFNFCDRRNTIQQSRRLTLKTLNSSELAKKFCFPRRTESCQGLISLRKTHRFAVLNSNDGHLPVSISEEESNTNHALNHQSSAIFSKWSPPAYLWRGLSVFVLAGQVIIRALKGKIHWRNTLQQLEKVGPKSVGVCLLTSAFVGMAFTIQFVREFTRLGLNRSVGGVLALAFSRELSPVVTSIVVAGRIGSAYAAELGTMQVSEQTDTLRVLGANPVDYLVTPRVIASCLALPFLTLMCFMLGMASSAFLADSVYGISINIILDSAQRALKSWDIISAMIKSQVFGGIISIVSCAWGVTTTGGAKGVGESTTSAVVISLVGIFIADFALSYCFFQGAGDSLKNCNHIEDEERAPFTLTLRDAEENVEDEEGAAYKTATIASPGVL
ncbi:ABC transporter permease MalE [Dillenia turbinata]|uniref:ABC transporter permease MalE n=1 Tax=Dillenia turbinata TaxID=194707 RepID=A0AAN8UHC4_9MAGN